MNVVYSAAGLTPRRHSQKAPPNNYQITARQLMPISTRGHWKVPVITCEVWIYLQHLRATCKEGEAFRIVSIVDPGLQISEVSGFHSLWTRRSCDGRDLWHSKWTELNQEWAYILDCCLGEWKQRYDSINPRCHQRILKDSHEGMNQ